MRGSRIEYALKNFASSTVSNVVNAVLGFAVRTVFVYTLGETYLGLNGLFINVLGILSLAELGIGSAINFSLYRPLAENDIPQIQAIINFYKTSYRIVAVVVMLIGVALMPFLKYILKGAEGIPNVYIYYLIFLANSCSSYLVTYKSTVLSADQRNYVLVNINMVIKSSVAIVQIVILLVNHDYLLYLMTDFVFQLIGKMYINHFVNRKYPFLKGRNDQNLSKKDRDVVYSKIKALLMHKIGNVSINQTDNIITSTFINVTAVGLVSNFLMIIKMVNTFVQSFFISATAGIGNLIVTENQQTRYRIAKGYDLFGFIFYGWSAMVLFFSLTPFVALWLGEERLIDEITIALLCLNYYLTGVRVPLANVKSAAGMFEQDRMVPLIQTIVNIVVSIVGVKCWGLKGIYIGTLISSMFPNIIQPMIVYKHIFRKSSKEYFITYVKRIIFLLCNVILIKSILRMCVISNEYGNFILVFAVSATVPLLSMVAFLRKTEEFRYVEGIVFSTIEKLKGKTD